MFQFYKGGVKEGVVFTDVHSSGKMLGLFENKKIYTSQAITGEVANVRLDRRQRGFYNGIAEEIQTSSPFRIKPKCRFAGICGGCNWQHIDYSFQMELKQRILYNALQKYNISFDQIAPLVPAPQLFEFRNKTEYSFWEQGIRINENAEYEECSNVIGFHPFDRRDITVDISECYIQHHISRKIYDAVKKAALLQKLPFYHYENKTGFLRNLVIRNSSSGDFIVIIGFLNNNESFIVPFLKDLEISLPRNVKLLYTIVSSPERGFTDGDIYSVNNKLSNDYLEERLNGLIFRYGPKSFFQPNPKQAEIIFEGVGEMANTQRNELVYDLYTGVGTIACHLAGKFRNIIGIEGSEEAIKYAQKNAEINTIENVRFICGDILGTFNNQFVAENGKPDLVVLDPPRSGTLIEIKKAILNAQPEKIIYVSCNPVSLAYDLTMLTKGYTIREIQPFDMFPHTHHVETIVLLEKN